MFRSTKSNKISFQWQELNDKYFCYFTASMLVSLFRFLLSGRKPEPRQVARTHGVRAKRGTGGEGWRGKELGAFSKPGLSSRLFLSFPAPPPAINFLYPLSPCPRATPTCLKGSKETEKTATQASWCPSRYSNSF